MALVLGSPLPRFQADVEISTIAQVDANTNVEQTFTSTTYAKLKGLRTDMIVLVNASEAMNVGITGASVLTNDSITIMFSNTTAGNLTPGATSGTVTFKIVGF